MKKLLFAITVLLLATASLQCGTINVGWSFMTNQDVHITDIQFMPDNDYFLLATDKGIQLRKSLTGDSIVTYSYPSNGIEITNDSTRLISIGTRSLELRKLSDMSLIKSYKLPNDSDSINASFFNEIVTDPIRPYIYAIWSKQGWVINDYYIFRKIFVINYETMEKVGELTMDNEAVWLKNLGISKDGKYLAAINEGESYLTVWGLDSMKKVRSFHLCNYYNAYDEGSGSPTCLKFSEINTDNIFYSGVFPQSETDSGKSQGLYIYNIKSNSIIDSTYNWNNRGIASGIFTLFNNEKRILYLGLKLSVFNLNENKEEFSTTYNSIGFALGNKTYYSKINNYFLSAEVVNINAYTYSMVYYDTTATSIKDNETINKTIYPNPTNNFLNINLQCNDENQKYEIYDVNSQIIIMSPINSQIQKNITIDCSTFQNGIYFLKIYCGNTVSTYKIVKEG